MSDINAPFACGKDVVVAREVVQVTFNEVLVGQELVGVRAIVRGGNGVLVGLKLVNERTVKDVEGFLGNSVVEFSATIDFVGEAFVGNCGSELSLDDLDHLRLKDVSDTSRVLRGHIECLDGVVVKSVEDVIEICDAIIDVLGRVSNLFIDTGAGSRVTCSDINREVELNIGRSVGVLGSERVGHGDGHRVDSSLGRFKVNSVDSIGGVAGRQIFSRAIWLRNRDGVNIITPVSSISILISALESQSEGGSSSAC